MSNSLPHRGVVHLGLDVSKDWNAVGVLRPDEQVPDTERLFHDEESVRRLIHRVGPPAQLRTCYEAGPTGYGLHRLLTSLGVACDVIAPSMIPRKPGDKVKTDKRDCRRLARLHRAGELTAVRVPTVAEEGVRDVCRARQVAVEDLSRARHRLGSFLLRHSVVWRGGLNWSLRHRQWGRQPHLHRSGGPFGVTLLPRRGDHPRGVAGRDGRRAHRPGATTNCSPMPSPASAPTAASTRWGC